MADGTGTTIERGRLRTGASFARRRVLDAVVLDGTLAIPILARDSEDVLDLLDGAPDGEPLRVCRAITDSGAVVLGQADPGRDPLLSFVLGGPGGVEV